MELREVTLYHLVMRLRETFETSFGRMVNRHCIIIKLVDDNGIVGWGEAPVDDGPWYAYETVETALHIYKDFIIPLLMKNPEIPDPPSFIKLVSRIRGHPITKAGFEFALWDLYAKRLGEPLYKVIGGVRDRVEAGISIGVIGDYDRLMRSITYYLDQGYRRVKIKIKPGWDIEPVKRIRREFGDIPLQVDANAAYELRDKHVFMELDKYDLLMIEQPLHYDDLYQHAILQRMIRTPICLDESIKSIYDAMAAIELGSAKIINLKPARVGGLTETLMIHDYAMGKGVPIWIGGMLETGIGRAFQFAAATLPNVKYPNDISLPSRFYEEDLVEPPWELSRDGTVRLRGKPGIGVDVLEDVVEKYAVKKMSFSIGSR